MENISVVIIQTMTTMSFVTDNESHLNNKFLKFNLNRLNQFDNYSVVSYFFSHKNTKTNRNLPFMAFNLYH
jgi:hypothetical protein